MNPIQYDKNRFKIRAIPHPLVLHWILNPGLIFNELILGQRIPKIILIDEESDKPLMERTYVPCPHCETLNDSRLWGKGNSFGHWFGFVCPNCHQIIPCLWNIFSFAILAITFPLWYFPARFYRHRWIEKEKERLANVLERPLIPAKTVDWLFRGIVYWGGSMWLILEILPQMWKVLHGSEWDLPKMFAMLPIWLMAGFAWGLIMRSWMNRKR